MLDAFHLYMLWGFYIFVESFAEGRAAYLSHGFRKYFRGCSGDFRDEYLCFGKTEGHASQYKIHKEKRRFYICVLAQRKIAVWAAKKPDRFGLFAGDIYFVSTFCVITTALIQFNFPSAFEPTEFINGFI